MTLEADLRANDALANERTFLAYLRTALSFVAFGFVVARFALFEREIAAVIRLEPMRRQISAQVGTGIACFGALIALYGGYRYAATYRGLHEGRVVPLAPAVAIGSAVAIAVVGAVVAIGLVAIR